MRQEILNQLAKEKFLEKIVNMETPEEVKKAFKEENIDVSDKELKEIGKDIYSLLDKVSKTPAGSELSDEEIEKVSGGVIITALTALSLAPAVVTVVGSVIAGRAQRTRLQAAEKELAAAQINTSWKGIIGKKPEYAAATVAVLSLSAAYAFKLYMDAVRDGSLKRWYESSGSSSEELVEE